ncbi:MAG TPA: hypothetical protein VKB80_13455 [Kofleriaceae bacterium]|nr:hypothetical protein [Kofleriaceae bacterium]
MSARPPSPVQALVDRSEGAQLRCVMVGHRRRDLGAAALFLVGSVSLGLVTARCILDPGFFAVLFGAAFAVGAIAALWWAAFWLFGHRRLIVDADGLSIRSIIGSRIHITRRLPLLHIRGISAQAANRRTEDAGERARRGIRIARVEVGEVGRRPWGIALGLGWNPEELDWLVAYLESGIALARAARDEGGIADNDDAPGPTSLS